MKEYYYAIDANNEFIFGNFPSNLMYLVTEKQNKMNLFEHEFKGVKAIGRFGYRSNLLGTIFVYSGDKKYLNSLKMFKELIKISLVSLESMIKLRESVTQAQNDQSMELIHNLTSLNAYCIQDLYALVPQDLLSKNINKQKDIVKNLIVEKPIVSASTILKLIKYNLTTKIEFSVFEKTLISNPRIQKMEDSIRSIILSILQIFIADFEDKNIEVSLASTEKRLAIDYDSLSVSLYYIFDNAVKYCARNTKFKILFKEGDGDFLVLFDMISIPIDNKEKSELCKKGYRSEAAKSIHKEGSGIGMYRIVKTLKFNDAELEIIPRISDHVRKSVYGKFEHNQIRIRFKTQKKWKNN